MAELWDATYRGDLRVKLIKEEAQEFADAWFARDAAEMVDALCDILYVTYGAANELGVDLEPFFREVHRSNMEKEGGSLRSDGKIMKPKNWLPPRIKAILSSRLGDIDETDN
jgi:predicted HAD superfamily Cof-like phosphohydrolase